MVGKKVSGTCEKIGFIDFSTTHFQCFTQLKTGPNSIFSHVPGRASGSSGNEIGVSDQLKKTAKSGGPTTPLSLSA
jgi:hypothetical protein